jgi:serine kinase of HPr protein (carbohydrate metabolism regulator)
MVHGTCIALDDVGVLLRGRPGSGKSDLALRLIETGACLVADDQVMLFLDDSGALRASAPESLGRMIEVRGLGLVRLEGARVAAETRLSLVVDLAPPQAGSVERLPEPGTTHLLGVDLPRVVLDAFEASAPAKVRLAVGLGPGSIMKLP